MLRRALLTASRSSIGSRLQVYSTQTNVCQLVKDPVKLLHRPIKYIKPTDISPLKFASALYATIHIHQRKFLVTCGDVITLPVNLKGVKVGDTLNFSQVSSIGSRNHTLTGKPRIDPCLFSIKGQVIELSRVRQKVLRKTKPHRRHVRHVFVKNKTTVIRIKELSVV